MRWRWVTLPALLLIAAFGFSKGFIGSIPYDLEKAYWLINYSHGFVRRALIGELVSFVADQRNTEAVLSAAVYVHVGACALLLIALWEWLRNVATGALPIAIFAVFAASQFWPTQAYDVGFLDVYAYLLVLGAALASLAGNWMLVGAIGFVGPFLHEQFVFIWLALAVLVIWQHKRSPVALLMPAVATAIVYFAADKRVDMAAIMSLPLSQILKDAFVAYFSSPTLMLNLHIIYWEVTNNLTNFLIAGAFFTLPAAVMIAVYGAARRGWRDTFVLALASLAPITIVGFGLDLSRFLVASAFSTMLAVLFMETLRPSKLAHSSVVAGCWLFAAISAATPFVYGNYAAGMVVDRGPVPLTDTALGRVITSGVAFYSRNIAPAVVPAVGTEDPPGAVWQEEEDAWMGIWTRRSGTNVFDAIWTKGEITVRCVLTITRGGNRVRVVRSDCSDGSSFMYSGWVVGDTVFGTFLGGKWHAAIVR